MNYETVSCDPKEGKRKLARKFNLSYLVRQIGVKIAGFGLKAPKLVQW